MISRRNILASAAATVAGVAAGAGPAVAAPASTPAQASAQRGALRVTVPTVEYVQHPLGLDAQHPRLSWPMASEKPGSRQSAYQVRVASSESRLSRPDVWDSGKVVSGDSSLVAYRGPQLKPRTRYFWSVRVWDGDGEASGWSAPSWWETGLMGAAQWSADWISAPAALTDAPSLEGCDWIWFPEGEPANSAPAATRWFRRTFDLPDGVTAATLALSADNVYAVSVNGTEVARTDLATDHDGWRRPAVVDVLAQVRSGSNVLAVSVTNATVGPAGLVAVLTVRTPSGEQKIVTDTSWKSADKEPADGWREAGFDDSGWPAAKKAAAWGAGPWGRVVPVVYAANQLRHEFRLPRKKVSRARLYATALGLYEAHLNGRRVGRDELAPGWTDYRERVQYQTYDVTGLVRQGANAIGAYVAPGWYAGNVGMFGPHQYGERPALLAQLEVEYADGTSERITSGTQWRAASGPIVSADLLGGETYDARKETAGWTSPGFDDRTWLAVRAAGEAAPDLIVAQVDGAVRVARELPVKKVTEPRPGVFVFDLGQNMVGSVRLRVAGPAGTAVRLRHAEVLNPDGTLYTANLRTAAATDTYILKGRGEETYEPRFTFHGFRYVEVTGFPGTPSAKAMTGRVMHTAAPFTFEFETNVPMLNKLHSNITWGQRGNFLSIPTDTPARDERLGWTGDINVFAPTAAYTMESARFLTKWLVDLRDAQTAEGAFTDVAPMVGTVGNGVAGWGDAGVTVPWSLYQAYGDRQVLEDAWPSIQAWLKYLEKNSTGLLRPASGYGDWLNVSDETPKDVIATAYFAHSADLAARTAEELGKDPAALPRPLRAHPQGVPGRLRHRRRQGEGRHADGVRPLPVDEPAAGRTAESGGRPARRADRGQGLAPVDGLPRYAPAAARPHRVRAHRCRLPAAPAALLPQLGLPDRQGRHHDVGTLGLHRARRRLPDTGHELLQPLRLRLGGRVDVHEHRRHLAGPARLPGDRHPPPPGRGRHLRTRHVHLGPRSDLHALATAVRRLRPDVHRAGQHDRRGMDPRGRS